MHFDPLTLLIALDEKLSAAGEYYLDDYESFSYALKGEFVHKTISVSGSTTSLTIKASNYVYNKSSSSSDGAQMENWQRPFLGDSILEQNDGTYVGYDSIEQSMSFSSSEAYQQTIDSIVRVERLTILSTSSAIFGRLAQSQSSAVKVEIVVGGDASKQRLTKSGIVSVETISSAQLYGEEVAGKTDGVLKTCRLTVKDPGVGVGQDWTITLTW
jgi:hypothetical protein